MTKSESQYSVLKPHEEEFSNKEKTKHTYVYNLSQNVMQTNHSNN